MLYVISYNIFITFKSSINTIRIQKKDRSEKKVNLLFIAETLKYSTFA